MTAGVEALATALEEESASGRTRIDSSALPRVRRAVQRGEPILECLAQRVAPRPAGSRGYLSLEALRELAPALAAALPEALRLGVEADALRHAIVFNDWGLPSHSLGAGAAAWRAAGTRALPFLAPLLADRRPAPCQGSEEATLNAELGVRVCDYALALLQTALGRETQFAVEPRVRDRQIAALAAEIAPEMERQGSEEPALRQER